MDFLGIDWTQFIDWILGIIGILVGLGAFWKIGWGKCCKITKCWLCATGAVIIVVLFVTSIVFLIDYMIENESELAHRLFDGKNSANLRVDIQPTPPLSVGQEMYLHFTNNSDRNGYLLAFNINSKGDLESFIPKTLNLPEMLRYLQIRAGQELVIPQPGVYEDPLYGLHTKEPTGQELLVVILVDELTSELVKVLLSAPKMKTSEVLQTLYDKFTKPQSESEPHSLQWSSVVIDYQTISVRK